MSEESQGANGGGIAYANLVPDPAALEQPVSGTIDTASLLLKAPERVDFGVDALGQWCIEVRAKDGTMLETAEYYWSRHGLDLAGFPVDSPAGAVALQEALKERYQLAEIVWRPGVMNSVDEQRALAQRALAAAAADRQAAHDAAGTAETSLRLALEKARKAGIGSGEMARRTGYARSTVTKALSNLPRVRVADGAQASVPDQAQGCAE